MPKYYVQSGSLRTVIAAESTRKAAIWGVHQVMQQVFPIDGTANPSDTQGAVLSDRVTVSQRGFDRADATEMETLEVVSQWNEMVMTLDRLEKMLHRAA